MASVSVECLALDGSTAKVSGPAELADSGHSSTGTAWLRSLGLQSQGFSAGSLRFAEQAASDPEISIGFEVTDEFALQGGRLRLGSGLQHSDPGGGGYYETGPDGRLRPSRLNFAIWEGLSHSLFTFSRTGGAADLVPVLDAMSIAEREHGILCQPKEPRLTTFVDGPRILKDLPGIGILDITQLTASRTRRLPSHEGTAVSGGELFSGWHAPSESHFFLMVSTSAITYIIPHTRDSDRVLAAIESLKVSWMV